MVHVGTSRLHHRKLRPGAFWIYFGRSAESYFRARAALADVATEIPAGPLLTQAADEFRDELLNVDAALEIRSELRWQATDLAGRNLVTSGFLHACCSALVLRRLLSSGDGDLLVIAEEPGVARRLGQVVTRHADADLGLERRRRILAGSRFVIRQLIRGVGCRLLFLWTSILTRRRVSNRLGTSRFDAPIDTLLVTWAESTTFESAAPIKRETFFGELPWELHAVGRHVGYLVNLTTWVFELREMLDNLETARDPIVVPDETVRLRDALGIALTTLVSPARVARPFLVDGVDLSGFLGDELWREWGKMRPLSALRFACVGPFLRRRGLEPQLVVYPYENQPWEKMLRAGLDAASPASRTVGYQHTPISTRWFPYFPSTRDLVDGSLPDSVVVIGDLWRRLFLAHGYPPERLLVAPPLRQSFGRVKALSRVEGKTALAAGSFGLDDSVELVTKTVLAFERLDDVGIVVKLHPLLGVPPETFERALTRVLGRPAMKPLSFRSGSVAEALAGVDLVLYNTSSVAYEALAMGIPVIFVQSDFWFDLDPIPPNMGPKRSTRTPEEIAQLAARLFDHDSPTRKSHLARGRRLIADAFAEGDAGDFASLLCN